MTHFTTFQLEDVCSRLNSGKSIPSSKVTSTGSYPVIGGNGPRGFTEEANFDGECAIIGRQGAACGNVRYHSGEAYMTEHAVIAQANSENNTRYLAYLLSTMALGRLSAQSAQPGLSVKTLRKQEVSLPPKETQDRVVALLGAFDDLIAANTRVNDYLEEMLDALWCDACINGERRLLSDIATVLSGGTPKTSVSEYWDGGQVPFFSPKDAGGIYTLDTERRITKLGIENCNSALYPVGTVFLTARGTVGKVSLAGVPMAMNQSCFAFSGNGIEQSAVYQVIKSAVRSLKAKANGATFAAISTRDLKTETVTVPTRGRLDIFQTVARGLHSMMLTNTKENQRLSGLRDGLLPKLMTGEVDVSKVPPRS